MKLTNRNNAVIDSTLTTLAMFGDIEALNALASIYYTKGTEEALNMAFKLWQLSAKENNLTAINNVALCYLYGQGVDRDTVKAIDILKELADTYDCIDSMTELGDIYHFGIGVDVDYNKSVVYYMEAYKRDKTQFRSKFGIAYAYYLGNGVNENHDIAFRMFYELVEKDKYEEAIYYLGLCYYDGTGTEKNYDKAIFCFSEALKDENYFKKASYILARMYLNGNGMQVDVQKAIEYYINSYDGQNDHKINYMLGLIYSGKFGECEDSEKAAKYFNKIEIDLCLQIIYYVFLKKYNIHQDILAVLNEMYAIVNSDIEIEKMKDYDHTDFNTSVRWRMQSYLNSFEMYYDNLKCLTSDEYLYIAKRLKLKIEKCLKDEHLTDILKTYDDNVIFFANCIVKSSNYSTMNDYIQSLLNDENNSALLYVSKLFLAKKLEKNEVIDCNQVLELTLHKLKTIYQKYYPEEIEFQSLFQLEEQTKDPVIASYILDFDAERILSEDRPSHIDIDLKGYGILVNYVEIETDIVRKALEAIIYKILGHYVLKKEFSFLECDMLKRYPMNSNEKNKISALGLDEKIKTLNKTYRSFNGIKYINRIGYIWIEEIFITDMPAKWKLYLKPTEDFNIAKEQISKILDEQLSSIN